MKRWRLTLLLSMLLAACASVPDVPEDEEPLEETVSSFAEGCQDERSVVLLCEGPDCGFFLCRDVVTGMVMPVRGAGVTRTTFRAGRFPTALARPIMAAKSGAAGSYLSFAGLARCKATAPPVTARALRPASHLSAGS